MDDAQNQFLSAAQGGPARPESVDAAARRAPVHAPVPPQAPSAASAAVPAEVPPTVIGGKTAISEQAVAKVAAIAARSVAGVYALGTGSGRALGAVRDAVGGSSATQGVHVEVGETEVAVDVTLVAVYGTPLTRIADNVRAAVYAAVESLVGLRVVEVNVDVNDVQIPGAAEGKPGSAPESA
ncbi:Asp23/Gls24 family envelope stress response protein [Arthrobacter gengyunqii]|uniref:Asp23/Gls24 family envelope stress response protein n=1 Tax=Arthrobacter gengyunqii TaxID=2886940 RepID=A0A9X1S541_9MICC|nr:Asp23/Gls24 family envelope stress response protein [Arthrobacter gengyunqii]MCC3268990.1 Asp23/Gls24 family envelope stress response protein [Arthrobacter gengyunqii]UOY96365.1 Asp23/Gls24 family envelope stress response protein [Arthrobacter gengyunqii]